MGKKPETIVVNDQEVIVTQVEDGEHVEHKGKPVRVGQTFQVSWNGTVLGFVERRMVTRERKSPGNRYVNARWQSPGWVRVYGEYRHGRSLECSSKRQGVEMLLREAMRR